MEHVPVLSATALTFVKAKIKAGPLTLMSNKIPDIKILGLAGNNRLTVDQTKDLISLTRAHVSFSVRIHIIAVLVTLTITFSQRQDVAYWST
jgi:hypothetical protein